MKLVLVCVFLGFMFCGNGWAEKRVPQLTDLLHISDVGEPDVSADGQWVVYSVGKVNTKKNDYYSEIWRVSIDGKHHQQLTFSNIDSNTLPKWSPNGKWIAFLSDHLKDDTQIWIMSANGRNAHQLTNIQADISDFIWSPDSKQIAFIAKNSSESNNSESRKPIVLSRYQFKTDDDGYLTNSRDHLYLFNLQAKSTILLTPGPHDEYSPAWSPDGKYIAYVTKRDQDPDRNFNYDIYLIEPKERAVERQVTHFIGTDMDPEWESNISWSPDSRKIVYLRSREDLWIYYAPSQLAIVDIYNGSEREIPPQDTWFYKPKWSSDGQYIYALTEESGSIYLNQINYHTEEVKRLTGNSRYDKDIAVNNNKIVLLSTDDTHPPELFLVDSQLTQLTHHNKKLLDKIKFQRAENIQFKSFDGLIIDGLLIKPMHYKRGKKYPTLLYLHGGPSLQTYHEFDFDLQWMASSGYLVIAPNPRGSSGRGLNFSKAIFADWGNLDVKDVSASIDYAIKIGIADPQRLAVGGWSYGGILTDYVIASDKRFKAALSGAGSANVLSSYGIDQYTREYNLELGKPWENPELYLKLSYPFLKAHQVKAATLFMCGELDFNVPCEGSEQLYQALKSLGVPTELVIYPNEHHEFIIPSFLIDRLKRYTDWLDHYVK